MHLLHSSTVREQSIRYNKKSLSAHAYVSCGIICTELINVVTVMIKPHIIFLLWQSSFSSSLSLSHISSDLIYCKCKQRKFWQEFAQSLLTLQGVHKHEVSFLLVTAYLISLHGTRNTIERTTIPVHLSTRKFQTYLVYPWSLSLPGLPQASGPVFYLVPHHGQLMLSLLAYNYTVMVAGVCFQDLYINISALSMNVLFFEKKKPLYVLRISKSNK